MTRSLPLRAALVAALLLAALATALVVAIGWQANRALSDRTVDDLLQERLALLFDNPDRTLITKRVSDRIALHQVTRNPPTTQLPGREWHPLSLWAVVEGNGEAVDHGASTFEPDDLGRIAAAAAAGGIVITPYRWRGAARLAAVIAAKTATPPLTVLLARDIEDQRALARRIQLLAIAGIAALGLAALAFGHYARHRLLQRIATITQTSTAIMASGSLAARIPRDTSGDELDALAGQLNAMIARVDDLMTALRDVSDNIAHDLKTPINRLRNTAEAALQQPPGAQRDALGAVIEQADGIIQTFNALLQIARLEHGAADLQFETLDLHRLVTDVVDLYEPVAEAQNLIIRMPTTSTGTAHCRGNRQLLGQALANLIDNAIKYSAAPDAPHANTIDVLVETDATHHRLIVRDMGPGIAPADYERVLQRFGRLDAARTLPGTGLGLSLVTAIGRLHGGALTLGANTPRGLRATLTLPRMAR